MQFDVEGYPQKVQDHAYTYFGAHLDDRGVSFRVYAPSAYKVSVAGSFNGWNYGEYWMSKIHESGIYEIYIEGLEMWTMYKFGIYKDDHTYTEKSDPYGFYHEDGPGFASKVVDIDAYKFQDQAWMAKRSVGFDKPIHIYEVHLGSWLNHPEDTYESLAHALVAYLKEMHYTHVELMPITEYPYLGSWGYQVTGFFAVTQRYGSLDQFKYFVDVMHQNGYGVILDVVPTHFVKDAHGLIEFDGTCLYEMDRHSQWDTLYFDYSKRAVQSFFLSSVTYWCEVYHIDGLRMDAVSHLIHHHGNSDLGHNEPGLSFLKLMNQTLKINFPDVMLIAEDSSDYSKVTHPVVDGGLGFDYKWDLGWMNDTLKYYQLDPVHKKYHHNALTFSMAYFYSERFLMPLSHDEVVHGKKSIVDKMWGDYDQKFALAKNLYLYMLTHPGKKLNFMGNEIGHFREWDEEKALDWFLLDYPRHQAFKRYMRDLNSIYTHHSALFQQDYRLDGFEWLDVDNCDQSIFSYMRHSKTETLIVILNMTPVAYETYEVGVPSRGSYMELLNTEKNIYDGCDMTNYKALESTKTACHNQTHQISVRLAPFAGIILMKEVGK